VCAREHGAEVLDDDAGIERSGIELFVAEDGLHVADAGASSKEMRGAGVAQHMRVDARDAGGRSSTADAHRECDSAI